VNYDYAGDLDDKKSTTRYVFTPVGGTICWKSIIQSLMAMSITEAKYMAIVEASKEVVWLAGLVKKLGIEQGGVQLHFDS